MNTRFQELIQNLGKTIGIEGLVPDENGYLCLTFDEQAVNIEERDEMVFFYASLGEPPKDGLEDLYRRLLSANCFFRETQGATLGVDARLGVLICYKTPLAVLDGAQFETTVMNFVNTAEAWRRRIEEGKDTPAAATPGIGANNMWA